MTLAFLSARITAQNIISMLNGKTDSTEPWDIFPSLFTDEAKEADEKRADEEKKRQDFYIEQMRARADNWNKRRK